MTTLAVIAKVPEPGRVKTRLSPPLLPGDACAVAWACLEDTFDAVTRVAVERTVLLLDGPPGPWVPPGVTVLAQGTGGLGARLAQGFRDLADDALVLAMDTPQVDPSMLTDGLAALVRGDTVLGPAEDGGYWCIGLPRHLDPRKVFRGVPLSTPNATLGAPPVLLPPLRDVDTAADLSAVAAAAPTTRVAALAAMLPLRPDRQHLCH